MASIFFGGGGALGAAAVGLSVILATDKGEGDTWFTTTWGFAKQIVPLLFIGVFFSGLLLGQPGREGRQGLS